MNRLERRLKPLTWSMTVLLSGLMAGCGNQSRILGIAGDPALRPRVIAVTPLNNATGVPIAAPGISATFNEPVAPITGSASFTVTRTAGTNPTGTVSLNGAGTVATFTLAGGTTLAPLTVYTATVTGARSPATGLSMAAPYAWTFTTASTPDTTRPRVTSTIPATTSPGPTPGAATNTAITATFTEAMAPATINGTSFTLTGPGATAVSGAVTYASMVAKFKPAVALAAATTYTATVTTAATDLAGNALAGNQAALPAASNYVWTFTTGAGADSTPPTITLTNPANLATGVVLNSSATAKFSEAMDPTTITFTLQLTGPPLGSLLAGVVSYDALSDTVTFNPSSNLLASTSYTATITGAQDLAGNALIAGSKPNPWTFTTGTVTAPGGVNLGSAATFGIMATSAITNTGATIINGDVSLDPGTSMTGFPPGVVNGSIHVNDTVSAQARADLLTAYNYAKNLPPGTTISAGADLGALYPTGIPPGTYTSGSTMLVSTPLVLDAGGNANAVWVFQIGSSITTGASVSLANGAQAKNVFWVPTSDATIGVGTIFYGTVVAGRNTTGQTGAVINGRILTGAITAGTIALDTNTVNVP